MVMRNKPVSITGVGSMILKCIVCETQLESNGMKQDEEGRDIPVYGTRFTTYGDYGSTVIDSMGLQFIEVNICDNCLRTKGAQGYVLVGTPGYRQPAPTNYTLWDGKEQLQ